MYRSDTMNDTIQKRRGAGRPAGTPTTIKVKMSDLISHMHPNHPVVIGKKWAEEVGITTPPQQTEIQFQAGELFD